LRADVAVHEEACRFHIELFGDVFADLDEGIAALATGAGVGFVPVLDARH
jgi:hypothetical protein